MLKLCLKDLLAARWFLLANLAALFLYSLQPHFAGGVVVILGVVFVLTNLATFFFLEDRNKTEILYLSLPVKRKAIVGARYILGAFSLAVIGGAIFGLIGPLSERLCARRPERDIFPLMTVETAALFLVLCVFFVSLYLVLYHCFGFGRGTSLFAIAGAVLITLGVTAAVLSFPADFDIGINKEGAMTLFGTLQAFRVSVGTPLFLLFAAALVFILFGISHRLSVRFYEKREF